MKEVGNMNAKEMTTLAKGIQDQTLDSTGRSKKVLEETINVLKMINLDWNAGNCDIEAANESARECRQRLR